MLIYSVYLPRDLRFERNDLEVARSGLRTRQSIVRVGQAHRRCCMLARVFRTAHRYPALVVAYKIRYPNFRLLL